MAPVEFVHWVRLQWELGIEPPEEEIHKVFKEIYGAGFLWGNRLGLQGADLTGYNGKDDWA